MFDGIKVTYIYSACVIIETPDLRILCDPWFTEGIYDGAWYHFPRVDKPVEKIGKIDAIYVSHIHPDHYDPAFIRQYFAACGEKPILIGNRSPNFLLTKMASDGFSARPLSEPLLTGETTVKIVPHNTGSVSDIDTALVITYAGNDRHHSVVNTNDVVVDDKFLADIDDAIDCEVDVLLCGYTGAGPYPQTYFDLDDPLLIERGKEKKASFFARYQRLTSHVKAKVNIPFAGKYLLGGKLSAMNDFRGVADPVEVLEFDEYAVVLADAGGFITTDTLIAQGTRTEAYSRDLVRRRQAEISANPLAYEQVLSSLPLEAVPMRRLLKNALKNAVARSECDQDYYYLIKWSETDQVLINARRTSSPDFLPVTAELPEPRSEISIDYRYLFGLLTHLFHWNNAEVGSQFQTRRIPDVFSRPAQQFLNFLGV